MAMMVSVQMIEEDIFTKHYSSLCDSLTDLDNLLPYFVEAEIIRSNVLEEISAANTTYRKVLRLLLHIYGRLTAGSTKGFYMMLTIMEKHGNPDTKDLAALMISEKSSFYSKMLTATSTTDDESTIIQAIKCNEDVQNKLVDIARKMKRKSELIQVVISCSGLVISVGVFSASVKLDHLSFFGTATMITGAIGIAASSSVLICTADSATYTDTSSAFMLLNITPVAVLSEKEIKERQRVFDWYVNLRDSVNRSIKAIFHEVDVRTLSRWEIKEQLLPLLERERKDLEKLLKQSHT